MAGKKPPRRVMLGGDFLNLVCDAWGLPQEVYAMEIRADVRSAVDVQVAMRGPELGDDVVERFRLLEPLKFVPPATRDERPSLLFGDFDKWWSWARSKAETGASHDES